MLKPLCAMGAASGKEAFRSAVLDLVNNQQVREIRTRLPAVMQSLQNNSTSFSRAHVIVYANNKILC